MAQDIVGSLFGIQQQPDYSAQDYRTAIAMAEMNTPQQMGRFLGGMVGAPLGRAVGQGVGSLLGVEDPRLKQQKVIASAKQQGFKVDTVEGLQQLASYFIEQGEPGLASQVAQQMQTMKTSDLTMQKTQMEIEANQRGIKNMEGLQNALKTMGPDTDRATFINTILPFMDKPGDAIKLATSKYGWGAEGEDVNMAGKPGPMPKGFYRDIDGNVLAPSEMAKQRAGFEGAQRLIRELNSITEKDVYAAYSPLGVDWTTKEGWQKKFSGEGTVDAQSKIAVAKLQEVIDNLPPGAASDADMKQALSGFPGYGDTKALMNWVNRAKSRIQFIIDGMSGKFGWKPREISSGILGNQEQPQQQQPVQQAQQGEWRLK